MLCLILSMLPRSAPLAYSTTKPHSSQRQTGKRLTIGGAVAHPRALTNAQIASEFSSSLREISYTLKGQAHSAHVVPLPAFLDAAQPRINAALKNHTLAFLVVLRSSDGYTVALSMGELLPDYGNKEAYLALDQDGKPLSDTEAPARLLVIGDAKPSRWIQGIANIIVVDGLKQFRTGGKRVTP